MTGAEIIERCQYTGRHERDAGRDHADLPLPRHARCTSHAAHLDGRGRHEREHRRGGQSARRRIAEPAGCAASADRVPRRYGSRCAAPTMGCWASCWPSRWCARLAGRRLTFAIEVVAFSEEEGVRFGVPFIGSRALIGSLDDDLLARRDARGVSVAQAIRDFGLDPARLPMRRGQAGRPVLLGYLEFHIEQGPVLDSLNLPLGVVTAIVGQSRCEVTFRGEANHAGTTPMHLRRDALAAAARWTSFVERTARATSGVVATVGALHVHPGAANVVPGEVQSDARRPACG